jgi:hypothetical protein
MWLYIPSTSCLSAPGSEASTSASPSLAQRLARSVMWREKLSRPPVWQRRLKTVTWLLRLSGLTSSRLTVALGVESWMSSLRASRASLTPPPASVEDTRTSEHSGLSSSESWEKLDPPWSSVKTSLSFAFISDPSANDFAAWATESKDRSISLQMMLAQPRSDSGYSSWPTPDGSVANDGEPLDRWEERRRRNLAKRINGNGMGTPLTIAALKWPTPQHHDTKTRGNTLANRHYRDHDLSNATANWPAPAAHDGRRPGQELTSTQGMNLTRDVLLWKAPTAQNMNMSGPSRVGCRADLQTQAENWPTPMASLDKRGTSKRYKGDKKAGRCLNTEAKLWRTPTRIDGESGHDYHHSSTNPDLALPGQARNWSPTSGDSSGTGTSERHLQDQGRNWPTPTVEPEAPNTNSNQINGPTSLGEAVRNWPTPLKTDSKDKTSPTIGGIELTHAVRNWTAPRAEDSEGIGNHPGKQDSLSAEAKNWMTPTRRDAATREYFHSPLDPRGMGEALGGQAKDFMGKWPTPAARDWRSDASQKTDEEIYGTKGRPLPRMVRNWLTPTITRPHENDLSAGQDLDSQLQDSLVRQAVNWQTPLKENFRMRSGDRHEEQGLDRQARDFRLLVQEQSPSGSQCSSPTQNSRPQSTLRLNPRFDAWLMGLPLGWTNFEQLEMGSYLCAWRWRLRFLLSRLD